MYSVGTKITHCLVVTAVRLTMSTLDNRPDNPEKDPQDPGQPKKRRRHVLDTPQNLQQDGQGGEDSGDSGDEETATHPESPAGQGGEDSGDSDEETEDGQTPQACCVVCKRSLGASFHRQTCGKFWCENVEEYSEEYKDLDRVLLSHNNNDEYHSSSSDE